jgi:hypothetical protein
MVDLLSGIIPAMNDAAAGEFRRAHAVRFALPLVTEKPWIAMELRRVPDVRSDGGTHSETARRSRCRNSIALI